MREEEKVFDFLMGLDEAYTTVRSQILSVDPLPKLGRAYAIVVQEEKQRAVVANRAPLIEATALLTKGSESQPQKNGNGDCGQFPPCVHCGKLNHSKEYCYQIPNGETTAVHALGRIALGKILTLERVLGDLPSRTLIGVGRERNGLYYLEPMKGGQALLASNSVKANIGNVHQINLDQTNTLAMFNTPDLEPSALPTIAPQSNSPTTIVSHTVEPMSPTTEHGSSTVEHRSPPSVSNVPESIGSDLSTVKTPSLDPIDSSVINEIGIVTIVSRIGFDLI
ncbi:hypothetical protein Pint_10900 [Pistacia integerrima]|uniref:Uncharacterized protein n=1 Tax=Pistacia integerrima TaxID=434235 RepID=A0ACC0XKA3_9ROSI|nr:hypothetical protein Pint_10900 [Pistacia integerrima]